MRSFGIPQTVLLFAINYFNCLLFMLKHFIFIEFINVTFHSIFTRKNYCTTLLVILKKLSTIHTKRNVHRFLKHLKISWRVYTYSYIHIIISVPIHILNYYYRYILYDIYMKIFNMFLNDSVCKMLTIHLLLRRIWKNRRVFIIFCMYTISVYVYTVSMIMTRFPIILVIMYLCL